MIMRFAFALVLLLSVTPAFAAKDKVLDIQVIKSTSGIEAWLVEDHSVPVVSVNFSFEGGLAYDPEDKPGVGRLVSIMMDEGAGDLKSQEFQSKLSDNAISMGFTAGRDAFYGKLRTLSTNRQMAFDLLRLALSKPRFDADALERMKNANVADINRNMGDPNWLVARTFNGLLYEGHYYARPGFGTLDSMQTITRKDLLDFVRGQFARDVLKISISGDISKSDAIAAIDNVFGGLPANADKVEMTDAPFNYQGKTVLLPLEVPQTFIAAGQPGMKRSDKDWHAAMVMNYILGGSSFDARLMREIRKKRGLTYGVYSALYSMKRAAILQADLSASNDKAEEALGLLKDAWAEMAKDGPTREELETAKSYLTGSLVLELTSTGDIADVMNGMQRDGLDPDYINKRADIINALTMEDIKRVGKKLLDPEKLAVILVGKPKNIAVDILLDKPPGMTESNPKP